MMKVANTPAWIFTAAITLGVAMPVQATDIYRSVDENGNVVYTDRPPTPDAVPISLRELSIVETPTYATRTLRNSSDPVGNEDDQPSLNELRRRYRDFQLVSPAPEQNFWGTGQVAQVAWNASAPLSDGVQVIFYIDDQAMTEPTRNTTFTTEPMDRGEHQARVDLVTDDNRVIATAGPVNFHIKQNSRQFQPRALAGASRARASMTAIDELDTAVVELDAQQRFRWVNAAAEECLGASRDRLIGAPISALKDVPKALVHAVADTFQDQRPRRLHDLSLPGGQYNCSVQQIDEQRLLLECHSLEWNQYQQELQRLEVQTGLMSLLRRNLGHEIRNPLGGIRGAAQMMAAELGEGELGGLATMIMREVDRIDELIKRFWQPSAHREVFDIHRCLQEALELIATEDATVVLRRDYDPSIPPLQGDETAIRQLLLNLLKNAAQAGASEICVRTRIEHGSALLEESRGTVMRIDVEDDGVGVPTNLRPLLFLPMVTSRREGTGLGLALVQQIAADHDGLVTYAPREPGSRFSLYLPFPGAEQVRPGLDKRSNGSDQGAGPGDAS